MSVCVFLHFFSFFSCICPHAVIVRALRGKKKKAVPLQPQRCASIRSRSAWIVLKKSPFGFLFISFRLSFLSSVCASRPMRYRAISHFLSSLTLRTIATRVHLTFQIRRSLAVTSSLAQVVSHRSAWSTRSSLSALPPPLIFSLSHQSKSLCQLIRQASICRYIAVSIYRHAGFTFHIPHPTFFCNNVIM